MAVLETSMEEKKSSKNIHKSKKQDLLLNQDISYARHLAANDEKVRKRSLSYLKKYLEHRSQASPLTEESLRVLWKGLFYSMWMSDKPLVQEECAENISHLMKDLTFSDSLLFFKVGLITLQNEWIGIDQLRLNKFLMLVRRLLRQTFFVLKSERFRKKHNELFVKALEESILSVTTDPPLGLFMHFTDIYLEELAKVSDGEINPQRTLDLIKPYITKLAFATDSRIITWITKNIFTYLIEQHDLGMEYKEKYKIWKLHRFEGSINQIQKVRIADEESAENEISDDEPSQSACSKPMDPRAGRVNVELPQICFSPREIAEALLVPKNDPRTSAKTRSALTLWSERYQRLAKGVYPIGTKSLNSKKSKHLKNYDTNVTKAAKRLIKFEQKLLAKANNDKKRKRDFESHDDVEIEPKKRKDAKQVDNNNKVGNENKKKLNPKDKKQKSLKKSTKEPTNMENKQEEILNKNINNFKAKRETRNKIKKKVVDELVEKANRRESISDDDYNYCFERNSGIWIVTPHFEEKVIVPSPHVLKELGLVSKEQSQSRNGLSDVSVIKNGFEEDIEETSIFIPSRKYVKKLKKTKSSEQVEEILTKLRGKSKSSLNNLSSKQKAVPRTSFSPKKVKINTRLNVSQEIDEHISQVLSSPQVPWDSSKKPGKPLLKTPVKASPVNPFYKLKMY